MSPKILNLCARIDSHTLQKTRLINACDGFNRWDELLFQAESHGMGPLLSLHLSLNQIDVPETFQRGLRFLCLRHKQANLLLMKNLRYILSILEEEGIPSLILKGAALCQTLYPQISLRPMRDIDILFAKEDVQVAHSILLKNGFFASTEKLPDGYYHLPQLLKNENGMQICVELHHGLFPDDPPYYQALDFAELYKNSHSFEMTGVVAHTLAHEEMLWHLYQHGFHAPLTYEPYKLVSAADIVSLVEKTVDSLDWEKIKELYPQLIQALPMFHFLTPWNDTLFSKLLMNNTAVPSGVGEFYKGWPRVKLAKQKDESVWKIFKYTFFPSQWWKKIYYGADGICSLFWCGLVQHPMHIFRWIKIYGLKVIKEKRAD